MIQYYKTYQACSVILSTLEKVVNNTHKHLPNYQRKEKECKEGNNIFKTHTLSLSLYFFPSGSGFWMRIGP